VACALWGISAIHAGAIVGGELPRPLVVAGPPRAPEVFKALLRQAKDVLTGMVSSGEEPARGELQQIKSAVLYWKVVGGGGEDNGEEVRELSRVLDPLWAVHIGRRDHLNTSPGQMEVLAALESMGGRCWSEVDEGGVFQLDIVMHPRGEGPAVVVEVDGIMHYFTNGARPIPTGHAILKQALLESEQDKYCAVIRVPLAKWEQVREDETARGIFLLSLLKGSGVRAEDYLSSKELAAQ